MTESFWKSTANPERGLGARLGQGTGAPGGGTDLDPQRWGGQNWKQLSFAPQGTRVTGGKRRAASILGVCLALEAGLHSRRPAKDWGRWGGSSPMRQIRKQGPGCGCPDVTYKVRGTLSDVSPASSPRPCHGADATWAASLCCPEGPLLSLGLAGQLGTQTKLGRWFLAGTSRPRTLPILVHLLKQRKLLGIVHDHELLEQPLDDLADGGRAADVQLLDGIEGQVEGRPLVRSGCQVHVLDGIVDGLGPDVGGHRHWPQKLQMHFDEPRVGAVLALSVGGRHVGQGRSVSHDPIGHAGHGAPRPPTPG